MPSQNTSFSIDFPVHMGNEQDFDRIFNIYHAPLCYFCEQLTGESSAAQDIVSELFMVLWQRNTTFVSELHAQAFLYRSAKNACINLSLQEKRVTSIHEKLSTYSETKIEEDYLETMIKAEAWGEIYRAIENLPSQCSKVMSLSYIEGKSNAEIALELELSLQTVKNYKQRGIQTLKEKLPPDFRA